MLAVRSVHGGWLSLHRGGVALVLQGDADALVGGHYFSPDIRRHPRGTGVEIVITVDGNIGELHQRLVSVGIPVVRALQARTWGAIDFRVADPDGYFLRLTTPLGKPV
jgi:lactoylglutathione lyase